MRKIRVLVVDDSVVVRKIVSDTLSRDADLNVVAVAANGKIALQKIPQVNPDVITLDIEMPGMDGLETLTEIRKKYPFLPVIMFSTLTEKGASSTLEALALGATDYVTKPANVGSVAIAMQRISDELVPKIKIFCSRAAGLEPPPLIPKKLKKALPGVPKAVIKKRTLDQRIDIIAIGVSTGGPNALAELIPIFPNDFPVPIVVVQHMPPFFTKLLADRLNSKSQLRVDEAKHGRLVKPGHVYLAPGDYHMFLHQEDEVVKTMMNQGPAINSCRPSVDVLFQSLVGIYGINILAVVLTGMGQDGLTGCESIFNTGGAVIIQDEASSVVWGMPGFVAKANLMDKVLPLKEIGPEIIKMTKTGRVGAFSA